MVRNSSFIFLYPPLLHLRSTSLHRYFKNYLKSIVRNLSSSSPQNLSSHYHFTSKTHFLTITSSMIYIQKLMCNKKNHISSLYSLTFASPQKHTSPLSLYLKKPNFPLSHHLISHSKTQLRSTVKKFNCFTFLPSPHVKNLSFHHYLKNPPPNHHFI